MELQPQFEDFERSIAALQKRIDQHNKLQDTVEQQLNLLLQIIEEDIYARAGAAPSGNVALKKLPRRTPKCA